MIIKRKKLPEKLVDFKQSHDLGKLYFCKEMMLKEVHKPRSERTRKKFNEWVGVINTQINLHFKKAG